MSPTPSGGLTTEGRQVWGLAQPLPLGEAELSAWLHLLETPGIGRLSARKLLAAFGSPQAVLRASASALQAILGDRRGDALLMPQPRLTELSQRSWRWLCDDSRRAIITLGDALYPSALMALPDPPLLLYAQGDLGLLQRPALAIVGSRKPSAQGLEDARAFAQALGEAGLVVVSGLAQGIDAAAHDGALASAAGTIAVVGTGLDRVYPAKHRPLAQRVSEQGLLLSEFALGTPPLAENFPLRNRIIAGLSLGTLVVEAALRSGSLITARLAVEAGREVFAIPGSIHSLQAQGCHALIKQGAKLVETTQDVLDELRLDIRLPTAAKTTASVPASPPAKDSSAPSPRELDGDPILQALGHGPATLDTLQLRTGQSASELSVRLLSLELEGWVERMPGQIFQRVTRV